MFLTTDELFTSWQLEMATSALAYFQNLVKQFILLEKIQSLEASNEDIDGMKGWLKGLPKRLTED